MDTFLNDADHLPFLIGGGELGERIRAHAWQRTPLGSPRDWPQSLRSALSICLNSSFPTAIYWGPELRLFYNDAWAPIPAERHPRALGEPAAEVWPDIWHVVGPQLQRVMETGEGFSTFDQMLPMVRDGVQRETYWNYSFTAIRGENGAAVGVFNQGNETTAAVLARREAAAEIDRMAQMFAQAPGAVAVLRGPQHVIEIANPAYENLVGRRNITGKPVAEALPEVVAQGFITLLDNVYDTGEPYVGRAAPVTLERGAGGVPEQRLVDFVYQPLPVIRAWLDDPSANVRRAVTEGLRIWTGRPYFCDHPEEAIAMLSRFRNDESEYLRKSVGNALRDISKKHPDLVRQAVAGWNLDERGTRQTHKLATRLILAP